MTNAQEQAIKRLKKHKSNVAVNSTPNADDDVIVSFDEQGAFGNTRHIVSRITPEGRRIEVPE